MTVGICGLGLIGGSAAKAYKQNTPETRVLGYDKNPTSQSYALLSGMIDAALDEQNVLRFIHTLRDFANVSQYIVITHNKKTVSGAGTMLGVTMEESGVSKVITIRLENEGGNGASSLPDPEPFEEEDVDVEEDVYIPPHPPKRTKPIVSGDNQHEQD